MIFCYAFTLPEFVHSASTTTTTDISVFCYRCIVRNIGMDCTQKLSCSVNSTLGGTEGRFKDHEAIEIETRVKDRVLSVCLILYEQVFILCVVKMREKTIVPDFSVPGKHLQRYYDERWLCCIKAFFVPRWHNYI